MQLPAFVSKKRNIIVIDCICDQHRANIAIANFHAEYNTFIIAAFFLFDSEMIAIVNIIVMDYNMTNNYQHNLNIILLKGWSAPKMLVTLMDWNRAKTIITLVGLKGGSGKRNKELSYMKTEGERLTSKLVKFHYFGNSFKIIALEKPFSRVD